MMLINTATTCAESETRSGSHCESFLVEIAMLRGFRATACKDTVRPGGVAAIFPSLGPAQKQPILALASKKEGCGFAHVLTRSSLRSAAASGRALPFCPLPSAFRWLRREPTGKKKETAATACPFSPQKPPHPPPSPVGRERGFPTGKIFQHHLTKRSKDMTTQTRKINWGIRYLMIRTGLFLAACVIGTLFALTVNFLGNGHLVL